ncbi:MAG: NADH-quinone oxidoreductase subunit M [Thermoguttaceae bacterium]|jgi:NADH-quinone oxidoreductase subunit M
MASLLLTAVFFPLIVALLLPKGREWSRLIALIAVLLTCAVAAVLIYQYPGGSELFAKTDISWLGGQSADIRFSIALDGLSLWLFGLTALLTVVAVLVSWEAIAEQASLYYRLLLILETGMLGVFTARDIILFYVFFEFTLIPLFFIIGIWGHQQRRYAAIKFFIFTLAGSVLTFLGLLAIVLWDFYHPIGDPATWKMTFSIPALTGGLAIRPMDPAVQMWIFLALFAGFAVKVPLVPLHTWLPLAHVEAPTAGSVILAGVLLKIGAYGFARFNLPMLPYASACFMPFVLWLALAGVIYGSLVALVQKDIKRLIAYSSVGHMGFCMIGLFSADQLGIEGGTLQMINHGLSTGGLFAVVGMIYERYHTREITDFGGLSRRLPVLSFFMLVLVLSSIGLPGLNGFVGEFLLLLGMFQRGWMESVPVYAWQFRVIAVLAVSGVVLGAWYMLWMVQRVFYGPLKEPKTDGPHEPVRDLCFREIFALALLVIFIVWIGLQPRFFLDRMSPTLKKLTASVIRAAEARGQGAGVQGSGFRVQGAALCADNTAIGIQHLVRSTEYEARRHSLFFQPFEIDLAVCYSPQVLPTFILHFSSFILPPKPGNKLPGPVY